MTIWRLEWLRLVRTRRLLAVVAVYLFFGVLGPFSARYVAEIVSKLDTSGAKIQLPTPVPADGVQQFLGNTTQIGLLVVVLVAASALAFDSRREMAIFLRTRVKSVSGILVPALVVNMAAALVALVLGTVAAWYETVVLLGRLPIGRMLIGLVYGALFLIFVVSVVAAAASVTRGALATAGIAVVVLLLMAIVAGFGSLDRWLPTSLGNAQANLVRDTAATHYLPAAVIAVVASAALVLFATVANARREV
jgi:ABC-2 type transport system permease protein